MKRYLLSCLLTLSVPVCLFLGAAAQEGGTGDRPDTPAVENQEADAIDSTSGTDSGASDAEGANPPGVTGDPETKIETKTAETVRKVERRKKVEERKQEPVRQEEAANEKADRESGDNLLFVDHERLRYNRIPGITISEEEPAEEIVRIPDDAISGESKEKEESGGIFGKRTRTIAGWGIVVLIFIIFVIYSKTRSRHSKRRVVRTITKR
ncbi:MAG: hypothetical protein JW807_09980 [Spirochaetes bacterium]|nr:hypothetical protein [Spirochaetota bacterium]